MAGVLSLQAALAVAAEDGSYGMLRFCQELEANGRSCPLELVKGLASEGK